MRTLLAALMIALFGAAMVAPSLANTPPGSGNWGGGPGNSGPGDQNGQNNQGSGGQTPPGQDDK
jgi:Spy/CpxP family protein refolding chaperone